MEVVHAMNVQAVTLEGTHVRLEPLSLDHCAVLQDVALDSDLWRWTLNDVRTLEELRAYVATAIRERDEGHSLPFAILECGTGRGIGSTRFGNIEPVHRRVEIGWTWVGRPWQRSAVNTECKYLLLGHAFETLRCVRVELKTNALNQRSRTAILRIGATEEGTFRRHAVNAHGVWRDTVFYSILDHEWPVVKKRLESVLGR